MIENNARATAFAQLHGLGFHPAWLHLASTEDLERLVTMSIAAGRLEGTTPSFPQPENLEYGEPDPNFLSDSIVQTWQEMAQPERFRLRPLNGSRAGRASIDDLKPWRPAHGGYELADAGLMKRRAQPKERALMEAAAMNTKEATEAAPTNDPQRRTSTTSPPREPNEAPTALQVFDKMDKEQDRTRVLLGMLEGRIGAALAPLPAAFHLPCGSEAVAYRLVQRALDNLDAQERINAILQHLIDRVEL